MKKMIITLLALCAFAQMAHAGFGYNNDADIEYGHGGHGDWPGHGGDHHGHDHGGPGWPGHGGPDHGGPDWPGHGGDHHGPGYPGPQPGPQYEYVMCGSRDYRFNECWFDSWGVRNVYLSVQRSNAPCLRNRTYGINRDRIWVDRGCRAVFTIERY